MELDLAVAGAGETRSQFRLSPVRVADRVESSAALSHLLAGAGCRHAVFRRNCRPPAGDGSPAAQDLSLRDGLQRARHLLLRPRSGRSRAHGDHEVPDVSPTQLYAPPVEGAAPVDALRG